MDGNRNGSSPQTAKAYNLRAGIGHHEFTPHSGNMVTRHWRGDYSKLKAFLIAFFAILVLAPAAMIATQEATGSKIATVIPYAVIGLWGGVGLFRSGLRLARDKSKTVSQRTHGLFLTARLGINWLHSTP